MHCNHKAMAGGHAILLCVLLNAIVLEQAYTGHARHYQLVLFTLPLLLVCYAFFRGRLSAKSPQVINKLKSATV